MWKTTKGVEKLARIKRLAFWLTTIRHARIIRKWRVSRSFKDILSLDSLVVSASLRAPLSFYEDPRFFEDSQRTVRWPEIFIGNLLRGPCVHREPSCNSLPRPYTRGISLEFSWILSERTSKFCYCNILLKFEKSIIYLKKMVFCPSNITTIVDEI